MLKAIKILFLVALAATSLVVVKRKTASVKTFQWLAQIIVAVTIVLILGMILGIF